MNPQSNQRNPRGGPGLLVVLTVFVASACGRAAEGDFDRARRLELDHALDEVFVTETESSGAWTSTSGVVEPDPGTTTESDPSATTSDHTTWGGTTWGTSTTSPGTDTWDTWSPDIGSHEAGGSTSGGTTGWTTGDFDGGSDSTSCSGGSDTSGGGTSGGDGGNGGGGGGPNLPGYLGPRPTPTPTQCNWNWWIDTDGVDPETPGCHEPYANKGCGGGPSFNDTIGEWCEDGDVLVETNPAAGVCHEHECGPTGGPEGNPYLFSCSAYCQGKYGMWGRCVVAEDTCVYGQDSAYCDCGC